jgi:hypothetical protein
MVEPPACVRLEGLLGLQIEVDIGFNATKTGTRHRRGAGGKDRDVSYYRYVTLGAAILVIGGNALVGQAFAAASLQSANAVVSGCRFYAGPTTSQNPRYDPFGQGYCIGLLEGLDYEGVQCRPPEVTLGQLVRVVVQYIDGRPARLHEDFRILAIEAMKTAWPCQ